MHAAMRILALLLLTSLLIVSCERPGEESPTPPAPTEKAQPSLTKDAAKSFVIDIPALLNKDPQQVKTMMEADHGGPNLSFSKPSKGAPGEMVWTVQAYQFGFQYYQNGHIGPKRDGMLGIRGFPEAGHTVEGVMRAGNLVKDSRDYVLEIDDFEDLIEIRVIPVRK